MRLFSKAIYTIFGIIVKTYTNHFFRMKNIIVFSFTALFFIGLSAFQVQINDSLNNFSLQEESSLDVPEDVKTILDNNCLQCHGSDGSGKAKMKWNYTKMSEMQTSKLISKLSKISDEVREEKMPPKRYLKKHPEKKLSEVEKKALVDWADQMAQGLVAD